MGRALRLILAALSLVIGALLALVAVLLVFEFSIPMEGSKQRLAQGLSRLIDGEVVINGTLSLVTGGRPRIEATDLGISHSVAGYGLRARMGRVGFDLQLAPLLAGRVRIAQVDVRENSLCLTPENGKPASGDTPERTGKEASWYLPRIERILVEGFDLVTGPDCVNARKVLHVATLEWAAPAGGEPRIQARGAIGEEPWSAEISGPFLASPAGQGAPFVLAAEAAGARLTGNGHAALLPLAVSADIAFDSPEFGRLLALAGASIKGFGPLSLRGHLSADGSRMDLRIEQAKLMPGTLAGNFSVLWSGARPRVRVDAQSPEFAAFALEHWLIGAAAAEKPKPEGVPEWITATIRGTDGEFSLAVEQLIVGRVPLGSATYQGRWQDAKVDGTLTGSLGNRPIAGMLSLDMSAEVATLAASWNVSKASLPAGLGVSGTVGSLEGQLSGRAGPGEVFAESLRLNMLATDAQLAISTKRGKPIPLRLRSARADWGHRQTLQLDLAGTLLGQASRLRIEGPDAWKLLQGQAWTMKSSGNLGPLQITANGDLGLPPAGPALDIEVSAEANQLGTLAGDSESLAKLPAALQGRFVLAEGSWKATVASARLGKSRGRGELARAARPEPQPVDARITLDMLDLAELAGPPGKYPDSDRELIPGKLLPPDVDLALDVARLELGRANDARLTLRAKSRGGRLEIAPVTLHLGRGQLGGKLGAELSAEKPRFTAALRARDIEGKYLERWLDAAGWHFAIGRGELDISTSGSRPSEWAANAEYQIETRQVRLAAADSRERTSAEFSRIAITAAPGKAASLSAEGATSGSPLTLKATLDRFDRLLLGGETPFEATGTLASLEWRAKGRLPLESGSGKRLDLHGSAESADKLSQLLGAELPPVGPVALDAALTSRERDLSADVKISVGKSKAAGRISRSSGERPHYDVDLTASLLRVEDLGLKYWMESPGSNGKGPRPKAASEKSAKPPHSPEEDPAKVLRRFDARVAFKAERLTAKDSLLGSGELEATLKAGKLDVPRISFTSPDGDLTGDASADFSSGPPRLRARADVPRFRYGPLLKALDYTSDDRGELSLKFDLSANASPRDIAPHLNGSLDLLVFPSDKRIASFDLLGGSLLRVLTTAFDPDSGSKLNCAVAGFSVRDGIAKSETVLLDATRVRAAGDLEVNLETQALRGIIAPKSKRPSVFTAEVALNIGGTLRNPQVSTAPQEIAMAAARNIYFAHGFLFDVLSKLDVPADGSEECRAIYQRVSE